MTDKPVLITTDGSAHSQRMIPHAARLADALETRLVLLHVLTPSDFDDSLPAGRTAARTRAQEELRCVLDRLGLNGEPVIELARDDHEVRDLILDRSKTAGSLAMDSRGHGSISHLLHGSVALDILSRTTTPLLLGGPSLTGPAQGQYAYRILATTDGSPAAEDVLRAMAPLLTPDRFHVTLLHVHEHAPGGEDNARELAQREAEVTKQRSLLPESVRVEVVVREIPRGAGVDTAILETANQQKADAIAMSTHGHSARRHLLMGSVALAMLSRATIPLLLARA
jgi:nucleotide-binding universal stress UspA family protein